MDKQTRTELHRALSFDIMLSPFQLLIILMKEDADPEKSQYDEYYCAIGLDEDLRWLHTNKVSQFLWFLVPHTSHLTFLLLLLVFLG